MNCIHILPQLRTIVEKYSDDVVVIGVHSGKYIAERETGRILEASLRYEITHPIVNDRQFRIWRSYAVRAWPTLALIDRNGYVVGAHAGEFTAGMLEPALDGLVAMKTELRANALPHTPQRPAIAPSLLRYPDKITIDDARIAVADTGNHRVLIGTLATSHQMRIDRDISGGFSAPRGMAFVGDTLYVTDSENHTVSAIDLTTGTTSVIAGTGDQMRTQADRSAGALSSPWDIAVIGRSVYIAMAGIHQLWRLDLDTHELGVHGGNGGEDIVDGPNKDALLAQPMGITTDGTRLYFADAESSATRWSDVDPMGNVGTIVGTGLFDFGDVDGSGDKVRMQHQQGLAYAGEGRLLVADSYNDALKWVNIQTREAITWLRGFNEPGGVAIASGHAYVADTNAHRVMVVDLSTGSRSELEIA
ncbi:MAG TPA: thioredoxin-like domain-containing protein [Gemmatimonadaceae bacterium]